MKKTLFITTILILTILFNIHAQECTFYFPVVKGTVTEVKNYNAKDKLTGSVKSTVIESSGSNVKYSSEVFDEKGKSISKGEFEVKCKNGEFVMDMNSLLKGIDKDAYKDMDVKVEAKDMTFPSKLEAGQKLNDGSINMKISNQAMTLMNMTVNITNRKVEKFEEITTPAGKFTCAKITYDVESKMMVTTQTKAIDWISEQVGVVRSEIYDQKGKLSNYSVLTSYQ